MNDRLKVLIVGGYGTFGGRLVKLLRDEPRLTLIVAGRSAARAQAFCNALECQAILIPVSFDRDGDLGTQLGALAPDVLVDASGPFQTYGERPYRLIEACITRGIDYLDFADGPDFVKGVRALDADARSGRVFALSGVSSCPALTAAVVRRLSAGMARVETIIGGIAPSPYAGVGLNVIRALAGYAGRPVKLMRGGQSTSGYAFTEQRRYTIAPPGCMPLRSLVYSLVDVPDLQILPELWPEARLVWMGAAPRPKILHWALIGLAWLTRMRLIPTLSPLTPLMNAAMNSLRWGEHRGGMFVTVEGVDRNGGAVARSWHLLAESDDGGMIPSMAAEAIVRKTLDGKRPAPGARSGAQDLEIEDFDALFIKRRIVTGVRNDPPTTTGAPLYARVLGSAWGDLPTAIRAMHEVEGMQVAAGVATVERGRGLLARLAAMLFGFPKTGVGIPLRVRFETVNREERWTRNFAGQSFSSRQSEGRGRSERLVCERFGPFSFALALVHEGDRLRLILRRWNVCGLPLPLWLAPKSESYETVKDGYFRFYVELSHPVVGLIVRYEGWLAPLKAGSASNVEAAQ